MQGGQWRGLLLGLRHVKVWQLRLIDRCTPEEARFLVGVLVNHFQRQTHGFLPVAHEQQQQTVGVVQPRPVGLALRELLDIRAAKIAPFDRLSDFGKLLFHPAGVEISVRQKPPAVSQAWWGGWVQRILGNRTWALCRVTSRTTCLKHAIPTEH